MNGDRAPDATSPPGDGFPGAAGTPDDMRSERQVWYELATEVAGLGYWRFDLASQELTWSDSLYRMYGMPPDVRPTLTAVLAKIHPDDRERMRWRLQRAIEYAEGFTEKFRVEVSDGSWRVLKNSTVCPADAGGRPALALGAVLDVTETESYRVLAENGNDILVQSDLSGRITYISPAVGEITGFSAAEVVGRPLKDIVGPEGAAALDNAILESLADPTRRARRVHYSVQHRDGRRLWLEARPTPLMDHQSGRYLGLTDIVRDITDRKDAENRLELANVILKIQMEASPNGILLVDAEMRIISFNRRFAETWGLPLQEGAPPDYMETRETIAGQVNDPDAFRARVAWLYAHPEEEACDDIETIDGRCLSRYTVPLWSGAGAYIGRAWFFTDVTGERKSLARALRMARVDELTGLANRRVFVEAVRSAVARAERGGRTFAVLYLDLDNFKDVNDTQGHPAGDELLKVVADRLRRTTRETDTVARFGGDEFAIVAADVKGPSGVAVLAEKLIRVFSEPFQIQQTQIYSAVSIGIDMYGPGASDAETLLSHADLALYRAKSAGGAGYKFFTNAMDSEARRRISLATELHEAIAGDQLCLLYQPQVSLETGEMIGVEALVRWRHPRDGMIGPEDFLPVAEQMGHIIRLGHWVLWSACRQMRAWLDAGLAPGRMCVNLSALQFKAPLALETDIATALAETGVPAHLLELELTETVLMNASREDVDVLERLGASGVSIAIDDFGTGYSSLDYLRRFPVSRIKIAQTFVQNMETSQGDAAIVKATIGLARDLGIALIAEGVETPTQLEALRSWGCIEAQGYLFGRPQSADILTPAIPRLSEDG